MRPLYETDKDRDREAGFVEELCIAWQCEARKLPIRYKLDYTLIQEGIIRAFLEVKIRSYAKAHFDTYMISMAKVLAAQEYSAFAGVASLLAVRWDDEDGFIALHKMKDFHLGFGGRGDRGDSQDMEPVVLIPIQHFRRIRVQR
tara:strand:+ start:664 stop:1095 length:432 start_codon:yes stop_codon:yes gene_type:complete